MSFSGDNFIKRRIFIKSKKYQLFIMVSWSSSLCTIQQPRRDPRPLVLAAHNTASQLQGRLRVEWEASIVIVKQAHAEAATGS